MILVDPDLSPSLLPASEAAKPDAAANPPRAHRLPTPVTLTRFLKLAQASVRLKGQVTILLTTDPAIRKLNRQFRGMNKATDVLSFPSSGAFPGLPAHLQTAGDLAIGVPTALKQALQQGHSLSTEVKVLMLHGLLHLAGLDHESDSGQMARRERLLRGKLKLPQGLIERVEGSKSAIRKSASISTEATALKGHGFSRAAKSPRKTPALAAEGRSSRKKVIPPTLKPGAPSLRGSSGARVGKHESSPMPARATKASPAAPKAIRGTRSATRSASARP
jgi:probable rRNA maturation factor